MQANGQRAQDPKLRQSATKAIQYQVAHEETNPPVDGVQCSINLVQKEEYNSTECPPPPRPQSQEECYNLRKVK